jgi:hypothetical protein
MRSLDGLLQCIIVPRHTTCVLVTTTWFLCATQIPSLLLIGSSIKSRHGALAARICEMSTFAETCHFLDLLQGCNICGILQSYKYDLKLSSLQSRPPRIELPRFLVENELVLIAPRLTLKRHPVVSVHLTRPATRRAS